MIVKNESVHLVRCLASVRNVVDEQIVVDTGSTDGTQQIARSAGARCLDFPWSADFSSARNAGLQVATGRFILVLDADEYLADGAGQKLRALLAPYADAPDRQADTAFHLILQNIEEKGRLGMAGRIVRLFPNSPSIRYEWPIHEQVVTSLQRAGVGLMDTDITLMHTGYNDPVSRVEKQRRNLIILETQMAAEGAATHPMTLFLAGGARLDLGEPEKALALYQRTHAALAGEPSSELMQGTSVRMGTCLAKLKRWTEVAALESDLPVANWHPELLVLRGQAAQALDQRQAREWFERVLGTRFRPLIPAYDDGMVRVEALMGLANEWRNAAGRPDLGVVLLRAALSVRQGGTIINRAGLLEIYQAYNVS